MDEMNGLLLSSSLLLLSLPFSSINSIPAEGNELMNEKDKLIEESGWLWAGGHLTQKNSIPSTQKSCFHFIFFVDELSLKRRRIELINE